MWIYTINQQKFFQNGFYRTQVSGIPGVRSMGTSIFNSLYFWLDLTDVTLADEDTNSLTDNANRPIQGNNEMQLMQPGGKIFHVCQLHQLFRQQI